jgi:hypothetical protein
MIVAMIVTFVVTVVGVPLVYMVKMQYRLMVVTMMMHV